MCQHFGPCAVHAVSVPRKMGVDFRVKTTFHVHFGKHTCLVLHHHLQIGQEPRCYTLQCFLIAMFVSKGCSRRSKFKVEFYFVPNTFILGLALDL